MLQKISECEWDGKTMTVTLPTSRSELSEVIEFKNQDWVKNLAQANSSPPKKHFVNPNAAFPFQDDFSAGTIHGTSMKAPSGEQGADESDVIKIVDDNNDVSVLMTKTQDELLALFFRRGRRESPPLATGLPPGPILSSAARPPTLPLLARPGQHPSQLWDRRSPQVPETKVGLMGGRWAHNWLQPPL
jgi:hypothetical protein